MTENLQVDSVQSRQACFVRCCLKYDEIPSEDFLPLIKTIDERFAGKKLIYETEESNHYFGTGRTGSGKSWALAQLIPTLFMLSHIVVVFDVSDTYTKEKLYKMLPREVVDILFHFINVGVGDEQDRIPVNLGSLKSCNSRPDKKKTIFSVIRAATGHLDKGAERVLKQMLSAYLIDKNETVDLNDLCSSFILNDIANCTIDVEKILHITRRRRKAYLLYGDDDNAVMCKIFRQICVICYDV